MKPVISVLVLFIVQFCIAQDDGPYKTYHDNGQIETIGQHKNGERVGEWKDFYPNGNLREEYSFTKDEKTKKPNAILKMAL